MFMIGFVLFLSSILPAQQAEREKIDSTDLLEINPLRGLHFIELSLEKDVLEKQGVNDKKPSDAFYFRVEGEEDYTKVSYFGNNLSDYVANVEPAHDMMKSYRNLKIAHNGLFWGGVALALAGSALIAKNGEVSSALFVGLGSFSLSWIPNYFTQDKIPRAIGIYNESISKYQASNGTQQSMP